MASSALPLVPPPFANGPHGHIFPFRYTGQPRPLKDYLVERYGPGRPAGWAERFYPQRMRLNGQQPDESAWVGPGDQLEYLHLRQEEPQFALGESHRPELLHQDPWLAAYHKDDNRPVNPGGVYYFSSLVIAVREAAGDHGLTPLHRLDLETSGPVLFVKSPALAAPMQKLFIQKQMAKRYTALVYGRVEPQALAGAVWDGGGWSFFGRIFPDGQSAIHTRLAYQPLPPAQAPPPGEGAPPPGEGAPPTLGPGICHTRLLSARPARHPGHPGRPFSLLELEPVTGKTNQLRVVLAHLGHPIVGDKKYHPDEQVFLDWHLNRDFERLSERLLLSRQALACQELAFVHPFTGQPLCIRSPKAAWAAKTAPFLTD